ncbi:uncharacterized protein LOC131670120 isoform X2 [Phymastichus coffea]|uniref:uncharacterized protein LOC131670120 isoform X2 n=1 Tax=Phymastichus coffea TaxID=108790 RepID=UPI00273C453E|nr:uncharacterized protein LOC131670120 isoform X2 [Phymastichus coffea]
MNNKTRPAWCRPDGPLNVWKIVEGTEKLADGSTRPIRFSIQEVPEDRREETMQHMIKYFLADEPICKSLKMKGDPEMIRGFRVYWNYCLDQGIVEAAYVIDKDNEILELAAVNMLNVVCDETDKEMGDLLRLLESPKLIKLFDIILEISHKADARKILNVDKYIAALGLSVAPHIRGQKLGQRMLEASDVHSIHSDCLPDFSSTSWIQRRIKPRLF